jgi:hypothetical protein
MQIRHKRHEVARIMTVLSARGKGLEPKRAPEAAEKKE